MSGAPSLRRRLSQHPPCAVWPPGTARLRFGSDTGPWAPAAATSRNSSRCASGRGRHPTWPCPTSDVAEEPSPRSVRRKRHRRWSFAPALGGPKPSPHPRPSPRLEPSLEMLQVLQKLHLALLACGQVRGLHRGRRGAPAPLPLPLQGGLGVSVPEPPPSAAGLPTETQAQAPPASLRCLHSPLAALVGR